MTRRRIGMGMLAFGLALAAAGTLAGVRAATLYGCGGTPIVVCSRTAYLGKFVGRNVINPATSAPITVPMGFVPFVRWNTAIGANGPLCPAPASAEINLNITCTPVGGGAPVTIPTITLAMPTPTFPGIQSPPASPVVIPAGLVTPGVQYRCNVVGTYEVTFTNGSVVIGSGDTQICLVDPAPADPSVPRLLLTHIDVGNGDYTLQQRGDQTTDYYLIANNSLTDTVVFDMNSSTNQIARTPGTDVITTTIHAISAPFDDTDHYPQSFSGGLDPEVLIPLPDPLQRGLGEIEGQNYLAPGETTIVAINTRSYGMCADGSCSDAVFEVTGEWLESGREAIGCAGTTVVVDNSTFGRTPLCELFEGVTVSSNLRAIYSPAIFDDNLKTSTLFPGNLLTTTVSFPNPTAPRKPASGQIVINELAGTQLVGSNFASVNQVEGFQQSTSDYLRLENAPDSVSYEVLVFTGTDNNQVQHRMNVRATNFSDVPSFDIPFIRSATGTSDYDVSKDVGRARIRVTEGRRTIFNGSFFDLIENPPNGVVVDFGTTRFFQKNPKPLGGFPAVFPAAGVSDGTSFPPAVVLDTNNGAATTTGTTFWSTTIGNEVDVIGSVPYGGTITGSFVISNTIPAAPAEPVVNVLRGFDSSSSQSVVYPIALRQEVFTNSLEIQDVAIDNVAIKVDFKKPEKARDSIKVKWRFLIDDPSKNLEGQTVAVTVGGVTRKFKLDKKGKATDPKTGAKIRIKAKGNAGKGTLTIKKSDLAGFLADEGLLNKDIAKGTLGFVDLKFTFCGKQGKATAAIEIKGKQGKNAKAKQAKSK